jgi:hypothetical protein
MAEQRREGDRRRKEASERRSEEAETLRRQEEDNRQTAEMLRARAEGYRGEAEGLRSEAEGGRSLPAERLRRAAFEAVTTVEELRELVDRAGEAIQDHEEVVRLIRGGTGSRGTTPADLRILEAISGSDAETFLPAGPSAAEAQAFDELVESLQGLRRLGWIELEVSQQAGHVGTYRRKYIAAVARCTDDGRQAMRLLGK